MKITKKNKECIAKNKMIRAAKKFVICKWVQIIEIISHEITDIALRSHDCILGEVSGTLFTNQLFMLNGVETS